MYLSELFLKTLKKDFSVQSIRKSIDECEMELEWQIGKKGSLDVESCFFSKDKGEDFVTDKFHELMDFWDVFKEFSEVLPKDERENRWILQLVYEVDGMYHCIQNDMRKREMTAEELNQLNLLCEKIENIYRSKEIKFIVNQNGMWMTLYEMTLDEFEETIVSFNYKIIQNRVIELLKNGGIIVVVAGAKGLTPQRLHGYLAADGKWAECPEDVMGAVKDTVMSENVAAKIRGSLRGIKGQ